MNQYPSWSDADDETLRTMCAGGASASQIGKRVRRSKSAVIGRAFRLGVRLPLSTPAKRATGAEKRGADRDAPRMGFERRRGDWSGLVVESWDERKARRAVAKMLNDNDLPETERWAATFAFEAPRSLRAALGVLAGRLSDAALLRHVADRLDAVQRGETQASPVLSTTAEHLSPGTPVLQQCTAIEAG